MMRHLTEEEANLMNKLHNDKTLTEEEKESIRHKLIEIDSVLSLMNRPQQ